MGKRIAYLWRQHSYIRVEESDDDPGCIWGILSLLKYHRHWQNVKKKMLPRRKHDTNNKGNKKAATRLKGVENIADPASLSKRSFKLRLRDLMTKENSKTRALGLPQPQSPNHGDDVDSSEDILEIFKVNKHIFLKARLAKSGSFPALSKLQHKHTDIWPHLKDRDSDPTAKSMPLLHQNSQLTISKGKIRSMRRASSLTESTDRYAHLFNSTFNKDATKYLSRSFKLMNENEDPTPKFRRRLSLPECDYHSFLPTLESLDRTKDSADSGGTFHTAVNVEQSDDADFPMESPYEEEQILTDCETGPQSQMTCSLDQNLPADLEDGNPDFHYVKLVLELSGFTAKDQTWVWYTMQKPLSPTLFEEIELQYHPMEQLKCSSKVEENKWDRNLIFDLINEALVEIDERSCLYYPKALSLSCRAHQIPRGNRLLEEVWEFVERCLSWRPELDPTLDFAVAGDLHGRHGWMNLQIESECISLELEDMILDEFLSDEILLAIHQL